MKELTAIQNELNVPKNKHNSFGNYKYRSVEDIQQALKPLLEAYKCTLVLNDSIELIGERYYLKATATLSNEKDKVVGVSAYARETFDKKGMDPAQITGAASSYARKYALGGLFLLDDSNDFDSMDNTSKPSKPSKPAKPKQPTKEGLAPFKERKNEEKRWLNIYVNKNSKELTSEFKAAIGYLKEGYTINDLRGWWMISKDTQKALEDNA